MLDPRWPYGRLPHGLWPFALVLQKLDYIEAKVRYCHWQGRRWLNTVLGTRQAWLLVAEEWRTEWKVWQTHKRDRVRRGLADD